MHDNHVSHLESTAKSWVFFLCLVTSIFVTFQVSHVTQYCLSFPIAAHQLHSFFLFVVLSFLLRDRIPCHFPIYYSKISQSLLSQGALLHQLSPFLFFCRISLHQSGISYSVCKISLVYQVYVISALFPAFVASMTR